MRRCALALAVIFLVLAGPASAAEDAYYGYNYLSPSLPHAGTCPELPSTDGIACNGWNYWDYSRIYKSSGEYVRVGFRGQGLLAYFGGLHYGSGTFTELWSNHVGTHYNRTGCWYDTGGQTYGRCTSLIF